MFYFQKYVFLLERFFYYHSILSKLSCGFSLRLTWEIADPCFNAKHKRKTKCALTCSFQKMIQFHAFRGRKKLDVLFHLISNFVVPVTQLCNL